MPAFPGVAEVISGWQEEVTVRCEGEAATVAGGERERCRHYFEQYPDGRERAKDLEIVLVRVRPTERRLSDYHPDSFGPQAISFDG